MKTFKDLVIREPRITEEQAIHQFFESVLVNTFTENDLLSIEGLLEDEILEKKESLSNYYDSKENLFLVGILNNEIVGSIECGKANNLIRVNTREELKDIISIGTVYVHPKYQKHGLSNKLLKEVLIHLEKAKINQICFDSGFKVAQQIWMKKFGYPKYYIENYFGNGSHHMVWHLNVENALNLIK